MAATIRGMDPPVIDALRNEPFRFEFFQALRILEAAAREAAAAAGQPAPAPVGEDGPPNQEAARLRGLPSHAFATSAVRALTPAKDPDAPPELTIPFFGLIGPQGTLPRHYTQLVIDRLREKDPTLRDFLDLLHHRAASFFYRAWEKYRFPVGFERARRNPDHPDDRFTQCLFCLVGLGTPHLRDRLEFSDDTFLYYSGHFAHRPRNAVALEAVLSDCVDPSARVIPLVGQWLYLDEPNQSRLPMQRNALGMNCQLGMDVVVGERVWGVENSFRVRLGPLTYSEFCRFTPLGDQLTPLGQLVRMYVGPEFDFDVQPVLRRDEVPACRAGGDAPEGTYLGWNSWLISEPPARDADDAMFVGDGAPCKAATRDTVASNPASDSASGPA